MERGPPGKDKASHGTSKIKTPQYRKNMWSTAEDEILEKAVKKYGQVDWRSVAEMLPNRNAKQCRERWSGMVNPELVKEPWSQKEDEKLFELHAKYGNKWAAISALMPGRSRIGLRNRWNWFVRKRAKGIADMVGIQGNTLAHQLPVEQNGDGSAQEGPTKEGKSWLDQDELSIESLKEWFQEPHQWTFSVE
jgi:hypothetical protein